MRPRERASSFTGQVNVRVTASDGTTTTADTFRVTVIDDIAPTVTLSGLLVKAVKRMRFTVNGNENLSSATITVNGTPITLTRKNAKRFSGSYDLTVTPTTLTVVTTGTDLSLNTSAPLTKTFTIAALPKPYVYAGYTLKSVSGSKDDLLTIESVEAENIPWSSKQASQALAVQYDGSLSIQTKISPEMIS